MSKLGRAARAGLFAPALTGGAAAQDATIKFWNLWPENHDLARGRQGFRRSSD